MIKRDSKQTVLNFGTGDICINPGAIQSSGIIGFKNQQPREIGSEGDIKAGKEVSTDIFDVVMKFQKVESIDVVIDALNEVRGLMLESEGE